MLPARFKILNFLTTQELMRNWTILRYAALAPLYCRGAGAAIFVDDIKSAESFKKAQYWVKVYHLFP
jgi:hypothetical protein